MRGYRGSPCSCGYLYLGRSVSLLRFDRHVCTMVGAHSCNIRSTKFSTACLHGGNARRPRYIVQLLYTTFLRGYFDSRVPRSIDRNKRSFTSAPMCRNFSFQFFVLKRQKPPKANSGFEALVIRGRLRFTREIRGRETLVW